MNEGRYILDFNKLKKECKINGIFLTIDNYIDIPGSMTDALFVVCLSKHSKNWRSLLSKDSDKCPVGAFKSVQEARAFALGLTVSRNKAWQYK